MNAFRQMAKTMLTAVVPRNRLLDRGPRAGGRLPAVALTFDDGPHPELTPRLLDRLQQLGLRGTFFVVGRLAEKYADVVRRMADEGHEVANHTYSHSEPRQTTAARFLDEIRKTDEILAVITGRVPKLVRPPKGELSGGKLFGLWNANKTVVLWNRDPQDFRMKSADEMAHWCQGYQPADGDVVLFHDIHPHALTAMRLLGTDEQRKRFESVTISSWLEPSRSRQQQAAAANAAG